MKQSYKVFYDGEVLRPQEPVALEANKEYSVTIEEISREEKARQTDEEMPELFAFVLEHAEDLGIEDLAEQHDYYLYGSAKR